jgi:hypothetical protein
LVGDGTFQKAQDFDAGDGPFDLRARDYNCDRVPDIAVANFNSNTVSALMGKGDGTFKAPKNFDVVVEPYGLTTGKLDKGKSSDLATANFGSDDISVLLNSSNCKHHHHR